ncbi:MAG: DUF1501 domain-containing protein, partial [Pirellulales bacterium]|nr:DUF1501 domain-containing protein [Pirellulales bacterium]
MDPRTEHRLLATRRHLLGSMAGGIGGLALADLLGGETRSKAATVSLADPMASRQPPLPAKAKRMIVIHLTGSPPHLDLYDHKPELVKHSGEECPASTIEGKTFAFTSGTPKLLGTPRSWVQCGESGMELSDAIPNLHRVADRLCLIRSMHTDQFNHAPAELLVYTGSPRAGRPSLGSWLTYGLGSENANLPGFVVLISSGVQPNGGTASFGSGFLPSVYQGVQCRSKGDPVLFVSDPAGMSRQMRRTSLDALRDLNQLQAEALGDPETLTRIAQYELAYRMQASVPEVMDISKESAETLEAYGAKQGETSLANNCLLARRLVEEGVRFVHLFDWGWDFHGTGPQEDIRDGLT